MATNPVTYRISPEVDAELRALAEKHGGVDKALRVLLDVSAALCDPTNNPPPPPPEIPNEYRIPPSSDRPSGKFKGPILKPKDRK